jgi:hypothetical protein
MIHTPGVRRWIVTDDLPTDVRDTLAQLFREGQVAIDEGEHETARETVSTAETVATNKLPAGPLREELLHGCASATRLLDPTDEVEADAAAEYLAAMGRRLPGE